MASLTKAQLTEYLAFACALADAAAAETLPRFRTEMAATNKSVGGGFDPVTEADKAAERAIRSLIRARYPEHGVLGEEEGHETGASGLTWVIDPIDGTRAFIAGLPLWTTLIALNDGERPVLGLIDQPYLGERFLGSAHGAEVLRTSQRTRLTARKTKALKDAIYSTTTPELFDSPFERRVHEALVGRARLTRYGYDAYAYAMLAAGHIDVVVETALSPWDVQAFIPIIEAAGGGVGAWDENADPSHGGNLIAAATPELFAEVRALIAGLE